MLLNFILLFFLFSVVSAFFSSAETAFISVNKHNLAADANENNRGAYLALKLLKDPTKLLSLVLLGNNLVNVGISALVTLLTIRLFGDGAVFAATLLVTLFILLFCETIPKAFAVRYSHKMVIVFSYILYPFQIVAAPIVAAINYIVFMLDKIIFRGSKNIREEEEHNLERLRGAVSDARTILHKSHGDMLLGILDLDKIKVDEAMTPLSALEGINLEDDVNRIYENIKKSEHSHLVAYEKEISNCLGFINVKRALLLFNLKDVSKNKIKSIVDEGEFIPDTVNLLNLMGEFTERRENRAFVVDEYGATQGIVTLRDIMVKAIGKISSLLMQEISPGVFRVNTNLPIREINNRTGWNIEGGQASTIRGLIQENIESLPEGGVCFEVGDYRIEADLNDYKKGGNLTSSAKIWVHGREAGKQKDRGNLA